MEWFLGRNDKLEFAFAVLHLTTPANVLEQLFSLWCLRLKIAIECLVGHGGSPGSTQNTHRNSWSSPFSAAFTVVWVAP